MSIESSPSKRQKTNNEEPREVIELEKAMRAWGVVADKSKDHKAFWDSATNFVTETIQGMVLRSEPQDYPRKLPTDPIDAVREVFAQEFRNLVEKEEGLTKTTDELKARFPSIPFGPPYRWEGADSGYVLKPALKALGITDVDVDPLRRFSFERVPAKRKLQEQFAVGASADDIVVRAIVAHRACIDVPCVNCQAKALHWNAYNSKEIEFRFWKKLVCTECKSVYEIKSAPNVGAIEEKLNRGVIDGGNFFDAFHAIQRDLPSGANQFVAVIARDTETKNGRSVWPVYVAHVNTAMPQLKPRSFCRDGRHKIYSRILLEKGSGTFWFDAPFFECDGTSMAAAMLAKL